PPIEDQLPAAVRKHAQLQPPCVAAEEGVVLGDLDGALIRRSCGLRRQEDSKLTTAQEREPSSERKRRASAHVLDFHIDDPLAGRIGSLGDKLDDCWSQTNVVWISLQFALEARKPAFIDG